MSLLDESGNQLTDEAGAALLDEQRSPVPIPNAMIEELPITTTPASGVRSAFSKCRSGETVVSIRGTWGGATALSFVYTPVNAGGALAPPDSTEYPIFKVVTPDDTEKVFSINPSDSNYLLAVIPTDNNGSTDLQIVYS